MISSYSVNTLFIKINSSWLIFESIKDLKVKTSILFNLLIIDLYLLIPAAIAQIVNPIAELVIAIGITIKETQAKIDIYPVIVEAKMRKC